MNRGPMPEVRVRALVILGTAVAIGWGGGSDAAAEGRVTVRGVYYREASTRVVQPIVELSQELPAGFDVSAHYLLDAITSASVAAGVDSDAIFTEYRNEIGLAAGKTWNRTRVGLAYRYSAESDYWSHGLSLSGSQRLWSDSATLGLAVGRGFDAARTRSRTPECLPVDDQGLPTRTSCRLDVWFGGVSFSQVLSPVAIVQAGYEASFLDGVQANLYRMVGTRFDKVPDKRLRHTLSARAAYFVPPTETGFQLRYRYYFDQYPGFGDDNLASDPWQIRGHTIEARVYQQVTSNLEVRASYRYYDQNHGAFWCDFLARPDCYKPDAAFYASDPKLGPITSHMPELKLTWDARGLARVPVLRWFADGAFDISYAYLMQSTSFGNAHLAQIGYSLRI